MEFADGEEEDAVEDDDDDLLSKKVTKKGATARINIAIVSFKFCPSVMPSTKSQINSAPTIAAA